MVEKPGMAEPVFWLTLAHLKYWLIILSMVACAKGPGLVRPAGAIASQTTLLPDFEKLRLAQNFDVEMVQDTTTYAELKYGKNLLPHIKLEVNNKMLTIIDKNAWNWVRKLPSRPLVRLHIKTLNYLEIAESAKVNCANQLRVPALEINMLGNQDQHLWIDGGFVIGTCKNSGSMHIRGWSNIFSWSCFKGSYVDASELEGDDAYLYHYTINDCFLNAKMKVGVTIENKGNVYLNREPLTKDRQGAGAGKLIVK